MHRVQPYHSIRFCPYCGLDTLDRDNYRQRNRNNSIGFMQSEWICRTCGFGFVVGPSIRVQKVSVMHAELRKLRPSNAGISQTVKAAIEKHGLQPKEDVV